MKKAKRTFTVYREVKVSYEQEVEAFDEEGAVKEADKHPRDWYSTDEEILDQRVEYCR